MFKMIKRGQKRKQTALNDQNLPLKTSSSQSFYPLRVFGENSSQCNLTGRLENVEMRRTDGQYAKSVISFQNSYSLSMLTSSNISSSATKFSDFKQIVGKREFLWANHYTKIFCFCIHRGAPDLIYPGTSLYEHTL